MPHFTPPSDDIVPPIYVTANGDDPWYPVEPTMKRLFRHFRNQTRGRNIFAMSDGTFLDSQVDGTPANMVQPPTDPYARAIYESGGALIEQDFFQIPYVVRTYYGGSANQITTAEATALNNAGYSTDP
jgi:hypothetical protein